MARDSCDVAAASADTDGNMKAGTGRENARLDDRIIPITDILRKLLWIRSSFVWHAIEFSKATETDLH
jgi:hypothetical protein